MMGTRSSLIPVLALALASAACGGGPVELPRPRPLVLHSGARLAVDDKDRLQTIYDELNRELDNITTDPTFLIVARPDPGDTYPWETLEIEGDTARLSRQRTADDIVDAYEVYAHLHLMKKMGRLEEWLPEAAAAEGWDLEKAIVARMADAWLLGRTTFNLAPYRLLDELVYAREAGHLEALLLTLRADEFPRERAAWLEANPGAEEAFRAWYRETFGEDPPRPPGGKGGRKPIP